MVVLVVAVVVAVAYFSHVAAEKRRSELLALSHELGLEFDPGKGEPEGPQALFGCFKRGHSRRMMNTMRGELELFAQRCPCVAGDYEYKVTSSNGKTTSTRVYRFSYALVRIPWGVPGLLLRREHLLDKLAGAIGFEDIDFESEEFSRRFHVKCAQKKFAYDVIHPRAMEFLIGANAPPLEFSGAWCCITDGSGRWDAAEFRRVLGFARGFFALWPEHVVQDLETRAAAGGMRHA
jgi:hypothetical protein